MSSIITIPNPILRQKSNLVAIDQNTISLVEKLKSNLKLTSEVKGVGLSAVQIGIPKRVFLAYSKASGDFITFINPQITWYSPDLTECIPESKNKYEGCLSCPNLWSIIKRSYSIKVRYQTISGRKQERVYSGFTATVIQHEYDHLEGILFIDRALQQGSQIYQLVKDENKKEVLEEIKL